MFVIVSSGFFFDVFFFTPFPPTPPSLLCVKVLDMAFRPKQITKYHAEELNELQGDVSQ